MIPGANQMQQYSAAYAQVTELLISPLFLVHSHFHHLYFSVKILGLQCIHILYDFEPQPSSQKIVLTPTFTQML